MSFKQRRKIFYYCTALETRRQHSIGPEITKKAQVRSMGAALFRYSTNLQLFDVSLTCLAVAGRRTRVPTFRRVAFDLRSRIQF